MPATPAWPPSSLPRLYVDDTLSENAIFTLEGTPANYLANVPRLGTGGQVKLFDDHTGEWLAELTDSGQRHVSLLLITHLRQSETAPDLWLPFATNQRRRSNWHAHKATQHDAARPEPVTTHHTH